MSLSGEAWLRSPERRRWDVTYAAVYLPVFGSLAIAGGMAVAAIDGHGPLFRQRRAGRDNLPFTILKLRTMPPDTPHVPSNGHGDERATKLGRILRKYTLDEAPQLINVIKGDMSLVGPRPLLECHIEAIAETLPSSLAEEWLEARSICRPGIINPFTVSMARYGEPYSNETRVRSEIAFAEYASREVDRLMVRDTVASLLGYRHPSVETESVLQSGMQA